jgi:glyoxylase-like metal-dependent hydrolase (beta-lactamase superfamily II)
MRYLLATCLLFLGACNESVPPEPKTSAPEYHNDYSIGHYTAPAEGGYVNSFWIEGPDGVVLIGAQRLPAAALAAVDIAESYTGKKVILAIVLHASADQFGGTRALQQRGIRVVTAAPVAQQIEQRLAATADASETLSVPEVAWEQTTPFAAAGLRLRAYVVRAGHSPSHVLIELDDHLFVGELLAQHYHVALDGGDSEQWIERLQEIARFARPRVAYPGRGYALDAAQLLQQQIAYLRQLQQLVAAFYSGGAITPADRQAIAERMIRQYPQYRLADLLDESITAQWQRLREKDHMMLQGR